ncbi:MAG TPA: hypothetical protein VF721_09175 [Pyrinomonadaceae bacterium]|jgi:hypothetical protein
MKFFALLLIAFFCLSVYAQNQREAAQKLHALFDEHWQWTLENAPTFASYLGDKRYNCAKENAITDS